MLKGFSQKQLALHVFVVVFSAMTVFAYFAIAHPKEVHQRYIYDVTACIEDGRIIGQVLVWGISEVIVPHDPNNDHEMKIRTFVSIRNIDWVQCGQMS